MCSFGGGDDYEAPRPPAPAVAAPTSATGSTVEKAAASKDTRSVGKKKLMINKAGGASTGINL